MSANQSDNKELERYKNLTVVFLFGFILSLNGMVLLTYLATVEVFDLIEQGKSLALIKEFVRAKAGLAWAITIGSFLIIGYGMYRKK